MAVNSEILIKTLTFVSIGMMSVHAVMATFLVMARLTSFYIYNSTCIIIQIAYVHV